MCPCGKHRTKAGCAGAQYLASRTLAQRQAAGREGGKTNAIVMADRILDRYRHLDREPAILQAWKDAIKVRRRSYGRAQTPTLLEP